MKLTVTTSKYNIVGNYTYNKSWYKLYEIGRTLQHSFVYIKLIHTESDIVHHLNKTKYLERKSDAIFCMRTHFSREDEGRRFICIY